MSIDTVKINGIDLVCDPDEISFGGSRRGSVKKCIDGSTIIQDRGFNVGDQTIQLKGRTYNKDSYNVITALYALYRASAGPYTYSDFKGNSATVVFTPGTEALRVRPIKGSFHAYEYEMALTVVTGNVN
jgi:hypothetical protein